MKPQTELAPRKFRWLLIIVLLILAAFPIRGTSGEVGQIKPRLLVFTKTTGYRHDSISDGIEAIQRLGGQIGFDIDASEDAIAWVKVALGTPPWATLKRATKILIS